MCECTAPSESAPTARASFTNRRVRPDRIIRELRRSGGRALIAENAKNADVIITTAQVPGRRAPLLVTKEAVEGMKRGSIIVDLAGSTGGNCALSHADETVERDGVTIVAPTNLPATVPVHASQLYSRNVTSFLSLLIKDGQLHLDMNDDIVGPSCVTHNGEVVNQRVAAALQAQPG